MTRQYSLAAHRVLEIPRPAEQNLHIGELELRPRVPLERLPADGKLRSRVEDLS